MLIENTQPRLSLIDRTLRDEKVVYLSGESTRNFRQKQISLEASSRTRNEINDQLEFE